VLARPGMPYDPALMRTRSHSLTAASAVAVALVTPSIATAQATAPAPVAVASKLAARVEGVSSLGKTLVALQGQRIKVRVFARPYVAGQSVRVVVTGASRKALAFRRTLKRRGGHGEAVISGLRATQLRDIRVTVAGAKTATVRSARTKSRAVATILPVSGGGANGLRVKFLQAKLAALGYLVPVNGFYDGATQRALIAFHKVNRFPRITSAGRTDYSMLSRGKGAYRVVHPDHGRHVEADLSRQILVLVNPGGRVYKIIHMSSGAGGTPTVRGSFRFYSKDYGTNAKGMVHSNYFIGGYAIHGYADVPTYNASHGCLRIPVPNASFVFNWVRLGMKIDVYGHA
jgi:hypothetical protein